METRGAFGTSINTLSGGDSSTNMNVGMKIWIVCRLFFNYEETQQLLSEDELINIVFIILSPLKLHCSQFFFKILIL